MEKTPLSMRKHIAVFGKTNAGKSTLFNRLLGQEVSIVSDVSGTTTDPVTKAMELIPYGPVALIDTAGLGDITDLGGLRIEKTKEILGRVDLVLSVVDINDGSKPDFDTGDIPQITVYTKCDLASNEIIHKMKELDENAVFITGYTEDELDVLKARMIEELKKQEPDDDTLLGGLVPGGSNVVMVVPIDSAAPKGRLILPQVQAIRDCLDNGMCAFVTTVETLKNALNDLSHVELVVTDSQAFGEVSAIVPENIPLTSFSMLLAHQKGRIGQLIEGTQAISKLRDGDEVLFLEACTHSTTHEDIGRVKIPKLLCKKTGKNLKFTYYTGYDFPKDIERYSLVVHCGGCMINRREIQSRLKKLDEKGIPVTNYGVVLAYLNGILDRASQVFLGNNE